MPRTRIGLICAGASLVELYTGLKVYEGPGPDWGESRKAWRELLVRDGLSSIAEAVGVAAPAKESGPS